MASQRQVEEVIFSFNCSRDSDIEYFLKEKAKLYEKIARGRTYLIFSEEAMVEGELVLLAYFTIALQTLKIPVNTSPSQIRKLDGLYAKKGNSLITEIPVFLIGQLGKNDHYSEKICGNKIINYALSVISRAQEIVGGRVVLVECQDNPNLVEFYIRNGFKMLCQDPADGMIQMIRLITS